MGQKRAGRSTCTEGQVERKREREKGINIYSRYVCWHVELPAKQKRQRSSRTAKRGRSGAARPRQNGSGGLSIGNRGMGLRGRRGVCASATDGAAYAGLWLRSGGCVRE